MRISRLLLTASILSASALVAQAQQIRYATKALTINRHGDMLTVVDASGKHLVNVDFTKPAFKGKVIAFAYSSKKKETVDEATEPVNSLTLFPNPASKQVQVDLKGEWKYPVDVQIFDKSGNISESTQLESSGQSLNIESLIQGVYILKVQSGNISAVKKLVVQ
jgi:hypothetical protein